MSHQEVDLSRYTRTLVFKPALSQMYDKFLPTWKSVKTVCKNHCTHMSVSRHVSVPSHRSRNFSDCCKHFENEPFSTTERSERVERVKERGDRMTCQCADDQQQYNCPTMTSWAHCRSLSKRRELVLSSLSTRPPLCSPSLGPQSLTLRVSFPCIFSPPLCIIRSVTSLSLATTTWTPEHPFFSTNCYPNTSSDITCVVGGGSFPVTAHGFSSKGVAAVRARRLFPSTISGVRGSVPVVPLGRKLDWQPVLSRAPKDPHLAV